MRVRLARGQLAQVWSCGRSHTHMATTPMLRREGPLEPSRAIEIVGQLAEALDAAHARGLIHRDVKPSNALVAREGAREHV
jgi:serine/threonine protein kinase